MGGEEGGLPHRQAATGGGGEGGGRRVGQAGQAGQQGEQAGLEEGAQALHDSVSRFRTPPRGPLL